MLTYLIQVNLDWFTETKVQNWLPTKANLATVFVIGFQCLLAFNFMDFSEVNVVGEFYDRVWEDLEG